MRLSVKSELEIETQGPVVALLNIQAQKGDQQRVIEETTVVTPDAPGDDHTVPETGNRYRRLQLQAGFTRVVYQSVIETAPLVEAPGNVEQTSLADLPFNVLPHLYASRYCPSDEMSNFAFEQFGNSGTGLALVRTVVEWVHGHVEYKSGVSTGTTTAADTFTARAGVCRDFAHLSITLCRALGIPARYVSAYALELQPPDFHAVFEVYVGDRWYVFDATKLAPLDGFVRVGVGRDAADTAFMTFFGPLTSQPPKVSVVRLDQGANANPNAAVSTTSV